MEKTKNAQESIHLTCSDRKNRAISYCEDDLHIVKNSNCDEDDEFCYEDDDFEEDHPFVLTRMTASCEGVYSIIGNNNGYHLQNGAQTDYQRDIGTLRAYAASMPHIASTSSTQTKLEFENELNKQEPCDENLTKTSKQLENETMSYLYPSNLPENNHQPTMASQEHCQNVLEEEGEEEEETLDLEFEYEPGISLSHMEFGRQVKPFQQFSKEVLKEEKLDSQKLFRRKMSEMCTSSSGSISQRERYQNMMMMTSSQTSDNLSSISESQQATSLEGSTTGSNFSNNPQMLSPSRCTYCGVDYESGKWSVSLYIKYIYCLFK